MRNGGSGVRTAAVPSKRAKAHAAAASMFHNARARPTAASPTATAASPSPSTPSGAAPHATSSAARTLDVLAQAWTLQFHQLSAHYLLQLSQLVEAYAPQMYTSATAGAPPDADDAWRAQLPRSVRGKGLGGSSEEDAALALDVDDLRRAERVLLLQLQAHQAEKNRQDTPTSQKSSAASAPAAEDVAAADSRRTSGATGRSEATAHRASRSSARSSILRRADQRSSVASSRAEGNVSEASAQSHIPDEVLDLFRHAQQLSAEPPSSASSLQPSTALTPTAAAAGPSSDEAEAEALARLCVKYFYTPKAAPTPARAPPPAPADRPWSTSPNTRRRSGHGLQHRRPDDPRANNAAASQREGGKTSPSFIDTSLFPPPNLHPNSQRRQQQQQQQPMLQRRASPLPSSSSHTRVSVSTEGGAATAEGAIPMSLSGPAAWRKLIEKRSAAVAAVAAATGPGASNTNGGGALEQASLPRVAASPSAIGGSTASRTAGKSGAAAGRSTPTPPAEQNQSLQIQDPNFSFGFPPPRALFTSANASEVLEALSKEDKDGPIRRYLGGKLLLSSSSATAAAAVAGGAATDNTQRLPGLARRPPAAHKGTPAKKADAPPPSSSTVPRLPPVSANVASAHPGKTVPAPSSPPPPPPPPRSPQQQTLQDTKKGKRAGKKTHLAPSVVLPPHYHGVHGEKLSTAELEQLVASVAQGGVEAQASLDRSYQATEAAAEHLYALQQSVAQVLLENVQLERDIATLTTSTVAASDTEARSSRSEASRSKMALPPSRRALLALPAPRTPSSGFATSLFANSKSGGAPIKTTSRSNNTCGAPGNPAAPPLAAEVHHDPLTVLTELRAATAAREAEHAQTLLEMDALADRIARHDALLQAVAEYWRRNAAVMKRQQFAVQAQPKRLSDAAVTWQSGTAGGERSRGSPTSAASSRGRSPTSSSSRSSSSSGGSGCGTTRTDLSGRVPVLTGTPSQLERALAHMEAVSPMLPSSAVSFDLHTSPSRTTENSSVPPTVRAQKRTTVRRGDADDGGGGGGMRAAPNTADEHDDETEVSGSDAQRVKHHRTKRVPADGVLSESSFPSYAVSSPTATATTGTTRTLFGSPDTDSEDAEREEETAQVRPDKAKSTLPTREATAAFVPSVRVTDEFGQVTEVGRVLPVSPPPSLLVDATARRDGGAHGQVNLMSSTSTSRREEEEVLQAGSWRTIAALQLENVDEIAEFIYSVFERA